MGSDPPTNRRRPHGGQGRRDPQLPAQTARELIERYEAGDRNFQRSVLRRANLEGLNLADLDLSDADLSGANLSSTYLGRANFVGADLSGAGLSDARAAAANLHNAKLLGANLVGAALTSAKLSCADLSDAQLLGANLARSDFRDARLRRANLSGADLTGTELCSADLRESVLSSAVLKGADLTGAKLAGASLRRATCDRTTYERSGWTPRELAEFRVQGGIVENLDEFPPDARAAILDEREGLTLYFDTRITPFDRFLIDSVIFAVLGHQADCRVTLYEARRDSAIVRLESHDICDVERVAEALWDRIWQRQLQASPQVEGATADARLIATNARLSRALQQLASELSLMRDKLNHMELRQMATHELVEDLGEHSRSTAVIEAEERRAQADNTEHDRNLATPISKKLVMRVWEEGRKTVTKRLSGGVIDVLACDD